MKIIYYLIIGLFCLILSNNTIAQKTYINKEWANTTGTVGAINRTVSNVDNNKNVIVVSNSVISPGNTDVLITKYDSQGVLLWQHTFDGAGNGNDYGVQVKIGNDNTIYIAAALQGTTSIDFGVLKYNANGTLAWSNTWNNMVDGIDVPADIEVDSNGNVYLVGGSQSSSFFSDYAIVKYNSSGIFQWNATYDHASLHDAATSLKVDVNTVVVTGASASTPTNWDYATLQINAANGVIDNVQRTTVSGVGLDNALAVTTDDDNNIYVTGYVEIDGNKNIQTVKINGDFGLEWVRNFDGGLEDVARSIGVDDFGNVYITGHTEKPNGGSDYITIKYDASGTEQWSKEYGSAGGVNTAESKQLDITADGDVIITGAVDKEGVKSFATIKYDSDGELKFSKDYDAGSGDNTAESIIVKDNDIFVSGTSTVDGVKQSSTVKYSMVNKPFNISYDSNGDRYVADELIVRFDKSAIIYNAIYDKEFSAGELSDFIKPEVWTEMAQKLGFSCKESNTYKIFMRMTPADSISITRLGEVIEIDDFWATLSVFFDTTIDQQSIIDSLETLNTIQYVERNYIGQLHEAPNDDMYDFDQIGLQDGVAGINVEDAWDIQNGKTHVKVGVFDSGINWEHEDYGDGTQAGSKVIGGWNFDSDISMFNDDNPDPNGHGTATSGIIGALRNNNQGVAGIAGGDLESNDIENTGAQLFSFKISDGSSGNVIQHSKISSAIIEGSVQSDNFGYGLHIQNHSWGDTHSETLRRAVLTCYENSCVLIASSGNTGNTAIKYPASYNDNWVIKVGANDATGDRVDFSTYGNRLDVIAPGTNDLYATLDNESNTTYTYDGDGTSFSAPMVSGVTALILSEHNPLTNTLYPNPLSTDDVERMLETTAFDNFPAGYDQETGHGKVEAEDALLLASLPNRIHHFQQNVSTSSATLFASNQTVIYPNGIEGYDFAFGAYVSSTDVYKLTVTLPHNIPSDETYVDGWVRNSSCDLYGNQSTIANPHWAGVNMNGSNQNNASLSGYLYKSYVYNIGGQLVDIIWTPSNLNSTVQFAYSIHTIDDDPNVGVEELTLNNSIEFYPNPVENTLSISYIILNNSELEISLYDITGKVVLLSDKVNSKHGENNFTIDMASYSSGFYLCKVQIGSEVISQQIIKN